MVSKLHPPADMATVQLKYHATFTKITLNKLTLFKDIIKLAKCTEWNIISSDIKKDSDHKTELI